MISRNTVYTAIIALTCVFFAGASSDAGLISETIFSIEATPVGGGDAQTFDVPLTSGDIDGDTLSWSLTEPVQLGNLGELEMASVSYVADPIVNLNFLVSTGGAAANFTVTSANLSFPSISNAVGRASGGITITDNDGASGASFTGNFPNNDSYRAFYNDIGNVAATGTTFATLVPGISCGDGCTLGSFEGFPDNAGTFSSVDENGGSLGSVSSMSAQWSFSVSQFDSASGTSTFEIVPEPSSILMCIFGAALLALTRRR